MKKDKLEHIQTFMEVSIMIYRRSNKRIFIVGNREYKSIKDAKNDIKKWGINPN